MRNAQEKCLIYLVWHSIQAVVNPHIIGSNLLSIIKALSQTRACRENFMDLIFQLESPKNPVFLNAVLLSFVEERDSFLMASKIEAPLKRADLLL